MNILGAMMLQARIDRMSNAIADKFSANVVNHIMGAWLLGERAQGKPDTQIVSELVKAARFTAMEAAELVGSPLRSGAVDSAEAALDMIFVSHVQELIESLDNAMAQAAVDAVIKKAVDEYNASTQKGEVPAEESELSKQAPSDVQPNYVCDCPSCKEQREQDANNFKAMQEEDERIAKNWPKEDPQA